MAEKGFLSMNSAVAFDTNLMLRWILQDDQDQAERVIAALKSPDIKVVHIADMALAEVVWVLGSDRIGYSRIEIVEIMNIILRHPKVRCNMAMIQHALPFYAAHPAVSFVDACLATYAHRKDVQLLTFDKKLATQHDSVAALLDGVLSSN